MENKRTTKRGDKAMMPGIKFWIPWFVSIIMVIWLLSGCAGWQNNAKTALGGAQIAAQGISSVVEPIYGQRCIDAAKKCNLTGITDPNKCKDWLECRDQRREINRAITTIYITINAGYSFIALGDKNQSQNIVLKIFKNIEKIREQLKKHGIIK